MLWQRISSETTSNGAAGNVVLHQHGEDWYLSALTGGWVDKGQALVWMQLHGGFWVLCSAYPL